MSSASGGIANLDLNGDLQVHIINDDTQSASLAAISAGAQESTLSNLRTENDNNLRDINTSLSNFRTENDGNLRDINSTLLNLDIWSNSEIGSLTPTSSAQVTEVASNLKSVRICYAGPATIYFQLHDKILATSFSDSTLLGMGYKLSPFKNDLLICFEAALQFRDGLAWAVSNNKFIYNASSENIRVFLQYMTV